MDITVKSTCQGLDPDADMGQEPDGNLKGLL